MEILKACPVATSLTESATTENREYTVTDNELVYQVPPFVVDPAEYCTIDYTYTMIHKETGSLLDCTGCHLFDLASQIFTFHYDQDLALSGVDFEQYRVEVTGTAGTLTPSTIQASFDVEIKNPCIDTDYVTIETVDMVDKAYDLYDPQIIWSQGNFVVKTVPIGHTLCGGLTYKANFMDAVIDDTSTPMTYDSGNYLFYSEDFDLIGLQTFTLEAYLTNYPANATPEKAVTHTLEVGDPCPDPNSVIVTT